MPTLILVRHGRSHANTAGVLAGRDPGVDLDDHGREQAAAAADRLVGLRLASVVTSPLERCRATAEAILRAQDHDARLVVEHGLTECDYGAWTGRSLKDLADDPLFAVVQDQPSSVVFPAGESMVDMQRRAVDAVRRHDAQVAEAAGPNAVWVAVSHGDVIKSVLADALGMELDLFQRLHVDPASMSVVRYGERRPTVLSTNTSAGDLRWLGAQPEAAAADHAPVGGGAGPTASPAGA